MVFHVELIEKGLDGEEKGVICWGKFVTPCQFFFPPRGGVRGA